MAKPEPILQENKDRFIIFPVKHHDLWDWYKTTEANFWTTQQVDFKQDSPGWTGKLNSDQRHFLKHLITLFASDGIMNAHPAQEFINEVQYPEAKFFYGFQLMMENIHTETWSLFLDHQIKEDREKAELLKAAEAFPVVQKKTEWIQKYLKSDFFADRLIAFAALESIFFSGGLCSLLWLKKKNLMSGLTFAGELISRDKVTFANFAVHLHNNYLINKASKTRIRAIILDAMHIERELLTQSLPVSLLGLSLEKMNGYLHLTADNLLLALGCEKEFGVDNPFDFIEENALQHKSKLPEKRAGAFQQAGTQRQVQDSDKIDQPQG